MSSNQFLTPRAGLVDKSFWMDHRRASHGFAVFDLTFTPLFPAKGVPPA